MLYNNAEIIYVTLNDKNWLTKIIIDKASQNIISRENWKSSGTQINCL